MLLNLFLTRSVSEGRHRLAAIPSLTLRVRIECPGLLSVAPSTSISTRVYFAFEGYGPDPMVDSVHAPVFLP